jgi:hypothetical protein
MYTDPSGELAFIPFLLGAIALGGISTAAYSVADHLDKGGSFNNIDWQDTWEKATIGAFAGGALAIAGAGIGAGVTAAATTARVAYSTIQSVGLVLGAGATGWQAGVGVANIQQGKPWTGALDLVGAAAGLVSLGVGYQGYKNTLRDENLAQIGGQLDRLTRETQATIRQIEDWQVESGNIPGLNPKSAYQIGEISMTGEIALPYGKSNINIYNPLANQGDINLDRLISSGRLTGDAIDLAGAIRLNDIRQNAIKSLNLSSKEAKEIAKAKTRNTAFANVWINNKQVETPDFSLKGISGIENINGFVRYTPPGGRLLKTKVIGKRDRAQDPEAKILEEILINTRKYDKIYIELGSERPVCGSCADVIANFLLQRPNARMNVSGSVIK